MESIADNLEKVRQRIQKATFAAGKKSDAVRLLGVSKKRTVDEILCLYRLGVAQMGENYLAEALPKMEALRETCDIEWHYIGPIQSNKTKPIAEHFDWVQSVDRAKIARRLSEHRQQVDQQADNKLVLTGTPLNVLIQVNINEEPTKSGVILSELDELVDLVLSLPAIRLRGLMAIPKADQSDEALRTSFKRIYKAFEELKSTAPSVDTLSMGMSGDIEAAIECGSTMVRVGTSLFGPRPD